MAKLTDADWIAIERDFRAGQLSNREIATAAGITEGALRKRAKRDEWERDLSQRVRDAVRNKLVRRSVRNPVRSAATEREAVEVAANRSTSIVLDHQAILGTTSNLGARLLDQVKAVVADLEEAERPRTKNDKIQALALASRAASLLDTISKTMARTIPLERQAYGIDDAPPAAPDDPKRLQLRAELLVLLTDGHRNQVIDGEFRSSSDGRLLK